MKEFLEFIVKNIVKNPAEVVITEEAQGELFIYTIKVAQEDMGIAIGKGGRTIKSIREMAIAKAIKEHIRINVILAEDEQPQAQVKKTEEAEEKVEDTETTETAEAAENTEENEENAETTESTEDTEDTDENTGDDEVSE